jgi:NOL1/NOP2/fmu family ribosome biogenesis protein
VTAGPQEDQAAAAAMAAGESAELRHMADTQRQQRTTTGSDVAIEAALTADDVAVDWPGSTAGNARPTLQPSTPPPVGQRGPHGPPDAA